MAFELDQRYEVVRTEAAALASRVEHLAVEADAMSIVHPQMLEALRTSGLAELMVPAAHGGRFDTVDPVAVTIAREELMGTSSHLDSLFALQGIGSYAVAVGGDEDQRTRWLPRVARAEVLAALALTEPVAGSDLKSTATTIVEDHGELVVDGDKSFISNAGAAGFYTVFGREGEGFSVVLVPADADGVSTEPSPEIIAPHVLGEVTLRGVRVPLEHRLGAPGEGLDLILSTLAMFRVSVAGAAVGLARAALEEATRHSAQREQFGRPLARLGPVAGLLADCWAELEAARLLTYRAASLAREDPRGNIHHSSMAKLFASEAAGRIVDRCVQVMGRWGLIRDSRIERLYRQARPIRIYEGASEVLRLGIAAALVDEVMD